MTSSRLQDFSKGWCYAATAGALAACLIANFPDPGSVMRGISLLAYHAGTMALALAVIAAALAAVVVKIRDGLTFEADHAL